MHMRIEYKMFTEKGGKRQGVDFFAKGGEKRGKKVLTKGEGSDILIERLTGQREKRGKGEKNFAGMKKSC